MSNRTKVQQIESPDASINQMEPAWDAESDRFSHEVYFASALKWHHSRAYFGAVFSGSNDRDNTPQLETICAYLQQVAVVYPVSLISVIGGSFFLDLVAAVDFNRIILCDQNIAEFAKISALCNILNREPALDPFDELEREILAAPEQLLPSTKSSHLTLRVGPASDWRFEGRREPGFPLLLRKGNFPEYAWRPSEDDRRRTLATLRRALARSVFLEVPKLDAEGHLIVVNCSNADSNELSDAYIRSRITNAAGILIVRSNVSANPAALDPHPYWEAIARSQCLGQSHQLWAPEDTFCLGTFVDETTHTSSVLGEDPLPTDTDTLVCHILAGKCKGKVSGRYALIRQTLQTIPSRFRRVVVAEYRPEGPAGRRIEHGFRSSTAFTDFYAGSLPHFDLTQTVYAPGDDDDQRNMFLVFDRRPDASSNGLDRLWIQSLGLETLYFVEENGFHPSEPYNGGTLRWTTGKAQLLIPAEVDAAFDKLQMQLWPLHPAAHRFTIKVNQQVIFEGVVDATRGFSETITFPLQQVRRIDIQSEIIVYRGDDRSLGVALRQFEFSRSSR